MSTAGRDPGPRQNNLTCDLTTPRITLELTVATIGILHQPELNGLVAAAFPLDVDRLPDRES